MSCYDIIWVTKRVLHLVMAAAILRRMECFKNPHYLFHISCWKSPIKMSREGKSLQKTKRMYCMYVIASAHKCFWPSFVLLLLPFDKVKIRVEVIEWSYYWTRGRCYIMKIKSALRFLSVCTMGWRGLPYPLVFSNWSKEAILENFGIIILYFSQS